jgi:hypothetical protein
MQQQVLDWTSAEEHASSRTRVLRPVSRAESQRNATAPNARALDTLPPTTHDPSRQVIIKLWDVVEREAVPVRPPAPVPPPVVVRETPARDSRVRHSYD